MPKNSKYEEILKIFENVKGSYTFEGKNLINKGSIIKHMDGKCNTQYTQDKTQYIGRYRCKECNKSTKGVLVDGIDIDSLGEYVVQDSVKEMSKTPTKPVVVTKEDFDKKFFNSDDFIVNGNAKEYESCLHDSYDHEHNIVSTKNLDRALILMPRNSILQAFIERGELTDDKNREMLLYALSQRGLLDKAKEYEKSVKNLDKDSVTDKDSVKKLPLSGKESEEIALVGQNDKNPVIKQNILEPKSTKNLDKTVTKTDKTKDLDEMEIQRLKLLEKINVDRKIKQDKTKITDKTTDKDTDKKEPVLDFMKYLSPENLGKVIGKAEMDIINIVRIKKFNKKKLNGEMESNCKESWKILIGWIQWKYGEDWMEHIPLVVFALNQVTTIATAITED